MNRKILVVDDDASGRAMLALSLRQAGFAVDSAAGGPEALALIEGGRPYDCLVTDARMDPMDGFELARRARGLRPGLRIALTSALFGPDDARGAPIDQYFPKPLCVEAVAAWLQDGTPA